MALGKRASIASREALEAVAAAISTSCEPAVAQLGEHLEPELRALVALDPQPKHLLAAVERSPIATYTALFCTTPSSRILIIRASSQMTGVERLERPGLPPWHLVTHRLGDRPRSAAARPRRRRSRAGAPGCRACSGRGRTAQDLVVEAPGSASVLRHELRLERAVAVARDRDRQRALLALAPSWRSCRCGDCRRACARRRSCSAPRCTSSSAPSARSSSARSAA